LGNGLYHPLQRRHLRAWIGAHFPPQQCGYGHHCLRRTGGRGLPDHIAEIIDGHIQEPPGDTAILTEPPEEITNPAEPPGFTGEDQCAELDLTPEECANAGTHTYSAKNVKMTGKCQPIRDFTCTVSHNSLKTVLLRNHPVHSLTVFRAVEAFSSRGSGEPIY